MDCRGAESRTKAKADEAMRSCGLVDDAVLRQTWPYRVTENKRRRNYLSEQKRKSRDPPKTRCGKEKLAAPSRKRMVELKTAALEKQKRGWWSVCRFDV